MIFRQRTIETYQSDYCKQDKKELIHQKENTRVKVNNHLFGLPSVIIYLVLFLQACGHQGAENKYLQNSHISQAAKDYYLGKFNASDDERTLSIVDSLNTKNDSTRYFYFLLISKMQVSADGALAEALGNSCKAFLEHHPNDLVQFLYFKNTSKDTGRINSWAKLIADEFLIECENTELKCVDLSDRMVKNKFHIKSLESLDKFYQKIVVFTQK